MTSLSYRDGRRVDFVLLFLALLAGILQGNIAKKDYLSNHTMKAHL